MTLDPDQQRALTLMSSGRNTFLTGRAGTGKSHTIRQYVGQARSRIDICATTGIAAINLQDAFLQQTGRLLKTSTIYRWAGMNIGPAPGQEFERFYDSLESSGGRNFSNARRRILSAEALLIDEVSMLPGRILDYLDYHLRRIRGEMATPFGGIQIIAIGDFLQLPPVAKDGCYDWAFDSNSWRGGQFHPVTLHTIHRQNEPDFIAALNDFREGRIRGETAALLAARVARFPHRNIPRLFTHNTMVDRWNSYQLECIEDHPQRTYEAKTSGAESEIQFLQKNMITPFVLHIKRGARVMITRNLSDGNGGGDIIAANGAIGCVELDAPTFGDPIQVRLDSGRAISLAPYTFRFDPTAEDSATVTQYPLRLAYAMTIHKSQGLTLDKALIDIRAAREPGQAYVALSRLRSLSGLHLKDWIKGVFVSPQAINFHRSIA